MALTYIKTSGLDPTSTFTFANVSLSGNIIPESNNVSTLGDPTHVFKDVYIGPGSLYIDGSKVLEASGTDIIVTADINQNLKVVTTGSGDIELDPTGTGVVALKGPLQFEAGTQATSSDGNPIHFSNPIAVNSITSSTANSDLAFSGNGTGGVKVNDNLTVTGDLIIQGTTGNLSVTSLVVQDNIIDISAETTGSPSANAGLRVIRGDDPSVQFRWNEVSDVWQITNDGTAYLDIVGKDSAGNVSVGNLTVTGVINGAVSSAATVTTNAQPNITSVGTLSSVTVSGLITATAGGIKVGNIQDTSGTNTIQVSSGTTGIIGNLNVGTGGSGNVTATYFIGNGSQLTGLPATYSNVDVAAYLPTYTGNVSADYFVGNGSALTGQVSNSLVAGTVYTNAQPNITSVGTLSGLTSTGNVNLTGAGNISLGSVANLHISGGTANYVLSTNGSGTLAWVAQSGGGGLSIQTYTKEYYWQGALTENTGNTRFYIHANSNITTVYTNLVTAGLTQSAAVIKKNGTTINTITIPAGNTYVGQTGLSLSLLTNDYLTVDITQGGASATGLYITIVYQG